MQPETLHDAAHVIGMARLAGRRIGALPTGQRPEDAAEGYAVQAALHRFLYDAGKGARVGWKLGCTTEVMQTLVGVDNPVYGGIVASGIHPAPAMFPRAAFQAPGAECEIALRFAADVPPSDTPYDRDSIASFIGAACAAMEIVDNRYGDWTELGTPTLIADDFFHAACVLGPDVGDWRSLDLSAVTGRTFVDGKEAGAGVGADVMGHPLDAAAWLANTLASDGGTIAAGDVVLTGSVVATQWIADYPCEVRIVVEGLGEATARFGES